MFTRRFWKAAGERAVGLFAGSLVTTITVDGNGMSASDWFSGLSTAGALAVASLLCSLVKANVGPEGPGLNETTRGVGREGDA
jgi:hypothetical protein